MRPYCLAVPRFHVELDPPASAGIRFCVPWREEGAGNLLRGLPLDRHEAAACLNEWQNMSSDELRCEAYRIIEARSGRDGGFLPGEAKALENFAGKSADFDTSSRLERAQRLLLLAWMQEKRALELRELNKRCASGYKRLSALLDQARQDAVEADEDDALFLPDWRFVLKYLRPFLPEDAILYTRSLAIRERLESLGCQRPAEAFLSILPEDAVRMAGLRVFCASVAAVLEDPVGKTRLDHEFLWITA